MEELMTAQQLGADQSSVLKSVQNYYGEVLKNSDDLKTSACCTAAAPRKEIREVLAKVPQEVKAKYYGCGSPFPMGISGLRSAQQWLGEPRIRPQQLC